MKTVIKRLGFLAKFGLFAGLLVTGQSAFAQESTPGTVVTNTASVDFTVNGVSQAAVPSNAETFWVDRRVDFTLVSEETALVPVTPGETGVFASFTVTNDSNGPLDFVTNTVSLTTGTIRGETITAELTGYTVEVAADLVGTAGEDPVLGAGNSRVVSLGVGETIRIHVYADVPASLTDADFAAVDLSLTAAGPGNGPLLTETAGADNKTAIDNVFANVSGADGSGNATETVSEGFDVNGATITAVKSSATLEDPITGVSADAKPIPGAVVEYTITVTNSGSQTATGVVVTDTIDTAALALVPGATASVNGGACTVDDNDGADGCQFDGTDTVTFQLGDIAGSGGTGTATFQVTVQ